MGDSAHHLHTLTAIGSGDGQAVLSVLLASTVDCTFLSLTALTLEKTQGPDNATNQLLPIIKESGSTGTEKEERRREMAEDRAFKLVC